MIIAAFVVLLASVSPAMPVEPDVTVPLEARALMLSMPRPQYPEEALTKRITGLGRCVLLFAVIQARLPTFPSWRVRVLRSSTMRRQRRIADGALALERSVVCVCRLHSLSRDEPMKASNQALD